MKEFEKHMAENYPRADRESMCWEFMERSWRESLRWLQENEDAHCCGDTDAVGDWADCPKNIAIDEELAFEVSEDERKPE